MAGLAILYRLFLRFLRFQFVSEVIFESSQRGRAAKRPGRYL